MATEDLNNTIEESLQLAVTHGKLNDEVEVRHVSERDESIYNYFRKTDNPLDVAYKQQAKVDVQNPIIRSLLKQINRGKVTYEGLKKTLDKEPDPRSLDLEERYRKVFDEDKTAGQKVLIDKFLGRTLMTMTTIHYPVHQPFHLLHLAHPQKHINRRRPWKILTH